MKQDEKRADVILENLYLLNVAANAKLMGSHLRVRSHMV